MERSLKNITITLPRDIAKWARIYAAEQEKSVSGLLAEILRDKMVSESTYSQSMERFLNKQPQSLRDKGDQFPSRDDLHDR